MNSAIDTADIDVCLNQKNQEILEELRQPHYTKKFVYALFNLERPLKDRESAEKMLLAARLGHTQKREYKDVRTGYKEKSELERAYVLYRYGYWYREIMLIDTIASIEGWHWTEMDKQPLEQKVPAQMNDERLAARNLDLRLEQVGLAKPDRSVAKAGVVNGRETETIQTKRENKRTRIRIAQFLKFDDIFQKGCRIFSKRTQSRDLVP